MALASQHLAAGEHDAHVAVLRRRRVPEPEDVHGVVGALRGDGLTHDGSRVVAHLRVVVDESVPRYPRSPAVHRVDLLL
eukprot:11077613-Heterocapsa_arctica.AAC.1